MIAFLGGIPGIIAIIDYFNQKPDIKFQIGVVQTADHRDSIVRKNNSFFFLTCAIINIGKKPLFPSDFTVTIKADGEETDLLSFTMPDNFRTLTSDYKTIVNYQNTKESPLVSLKKLSPDETFYGNFYSETTTALRESFTNAKERLIKVRCTDVFGKIYESDFRPVPKGILTGSFDIPKTGIQVRPNPFQKLN